MARSLKYLAPSLRRFNKNLAKVVNQSAKDKAVDTIRLLAAATPVDTSKALSNWRATVGFPASRVIPAYFEGQGGSTAETSERATVEAAREAVKNKKPGQNVFITNNVPYMEKLAAGGSLQAAPGWIEAVGNISARNWKMKFPTHIG